MESLFLKSPVLFGVALALCLALQVWISYVSACSILDGDFIQGFSFFLAVPVLAILLVFYYLWFRRQRL